jgi:hypothetical protein
MNNIIFRKAISFPGETRTNKKYEFKAAWGSCPHPDKAWKGG